MKSSWKRLHPLFVSSFPLNQFFAIVSVLSSSRFVFLYFNKKKKEWYISYFASYFLKKKKRVSSYFLCDLSFPQFTFFKNIFRRSFRALILSESQLLLLHFSTKIKNKIKKTKTRHFQLFTLKVLFTLVSKGCRKSKNTTFKLAARRREVICLVSLFKIFFDLGV